MTSEAGTTPFSNKIEILADLWMNYRDDDDFRDFFEYNDLGLPLAYLLNSKVVETTPMAEGFINETFDLLLAGMETEDTGFENLDDLLSGSL